jgi:hypothetical protein
MRSANEKEADRFDLTLFRLIRHAEDQSKRDKKWGEIAGKLRGVRPLVRTMMHPDDRHD